MELLKEYSKKFGIPYIVNYNGETKHTSENYIIFKNGWIATIVENRNHPEINGKYTVAMCDYCGYFDWRILNQYGAIDGCLFCNTELEIIIACENIRRQKSVCCA